MAMGLSGRRGLAVGGSDGHIRSTWDLEAGAEPSAVFGNAAIGSGKVGSIARSGGYFQLRFHCFHAFLLFTHLFVLNLDLFGLSFQQVTELLQLGFQTG